MSDKKRGHFTALERRFIAMALFAMPEMDNDSRADSIGVMDALGMRDEAFELKMHARLKELVKVPRPPKDATMRDMADAQEAYDQEVEQVIKKLDATAVPFQLDQDECEHILVALNKAQLKGPQAQIVMAEAARRLKKTIAGSYVAPDVAPKLVAVEGE